MKTVTVCMLLAGIIVMVIPVFAQDYGIPVPFELNYSETVSFGQTDWSPDGEWIAVNTFMPGQAVIDGTLRNYSIMDIMLYSTENGDIRNMTDDIDDHCRYPRFTPDSQEISFSRMVGVGEKRILYSTIENINISTREHWIVRKEAYGGDWSNNGRYFSYVNVPSSQSKEADIVLYDFENESETYFGCSDYSPLTIWGLEHAVRFSPDNSSIVATLIITSRLDGPNSIINNYAEQIHRVPVDGGQIELIPLGNATFYNPQYSPDGNWILFERFDYSESNIHPDTDLQVYNTQTGEILDLLPGNPYDSHGGSWSPDGRQICYVLDRDGDYELYIKDFEFASEEIQVNVEGETPDNFALIGNYPNPFNPTTTIEFSLPETGFAELTVYNLTGQKVHELVSGTMSEGVHSVVWNGLDDSGLPVSAGVYVTQFKMGNAVKTDRMMLVK